jgi:hypothetical protein
MAVGASGRIVIEIEPELKRQLYEALEKEGLTLKEWFLHNAKQFLYQGIQLSLDFGEHPSHSKTSKLSARHQTHGPAVRPAKKVKK